MQRLSRVADCIECGSTVIGYQAGEPCPGCGAVIYE